MTPDEINDDALSPVDEIMQQFLGEYRAGGHLDIEACCRQYPELAEQLRPALAMAIMLEQARPTELPAETWPQQPARIVLGDYRLIREAGRGGMGVVYEAIQESLGRRVALKTLPSDLSHGRSQLERFLREARAVASLHHTNIVPVFAVGEDQGVHYYVMPFIDGIGLEKILKGMKQLAIQSGRISAFAGRFSKR